MPKTPSAQQICPLCGDANFCAIAGDTQAADCWCMTVNIPRELIEQANQRNDEKYCICQACAERTHSLAEEIKG